MLLLEQFENLTLHPKNAARLKELVLQLAVQGKLTENWRRQNPDVEPAADLLKRIEAEKAQLVKEKKIKKEKPLEPILDNDVPYTLPESWVWLRLGELTYNFGQKTPDAIFSYIDVASVDNKRGVIGDLQTILPNEAPSRARKIVQEGCVIYSTVRPYLLNIAIVEKSYEPEAIASTAFAILNPLPSLDNKFLYYYLRSVPFIEYVESQMIGVAYPAINDAKLLSGAVPLPPLAEQEAIVARVEELMQKIEELEKQTAERIQLKQHLGAAALQQLTAATDEELEQNWLFLKQHFQTMFDDTTNVKKLRETILQLAVQGKLTATWRKYNPTIEPASELLKRIQAEKEVLIREKKIRREKPSEALTEDCTSDHLPNGWVSCKVEDVSACLDFIRKPINKAERVEGDIPYYGANGPVGWINNYLFDEKLVLVVEDETFIGRTKPFSYIIKGKSWVNNHAHVLKPLGGITVEFLNLLLCYYDFIPLTSGTTGRRKLTKKSLLNAPIQLPPIAEQEAIVAKVDEVIKMCEKLEDCIQQSEQEAEALMQAVVQDALQVQEEEVSEIN